MAPMARLELAQLSLPPAQGSVSTNFTTSDLIHDSNYLSSFQWPGFLNLKFPNL